MAFDFNHFMGLVRQANPHFKRIALTSHLDPLIKELKGRMFIAPGDRQKLEKIIAFIPHDRQQKYATALNYLTTNAGIQVYAIPAKPVMSFEKFLIQIGGYTGTNSRGQTRNVNLLPADKDADGTSPGPRSFLHRHKLTWSSSNGNPGSLATIRTREHVKFLANTQAPPFNAIQDPDREFYHPGDQGTVGANHATDDHSTKLPALICCNPRQAGTLRAEQWYQYSVDNAATWHNIDEAAFLIEKTVRQEGTDWVYIFKKTNWAPHNTKRFHFEVHYTVGPQPEYMPQRDTDVANGGAYDADIKTYARRVVSKG